VKEKMGKNALRSESGVVLVVALLLLLVLSLIGIISISTTSFENIISGNERAASAAFYAADGGVEAGVEQLPKPDPIPVTSLGNDSSYWGGNPQDKGAPQGITLLGEYPRPGYDLASWEFKWFRVNASGESFGAVKEVEVEVSYGPIKTGTVYNN